MASSGHRVEIDLEDVSGGDGTLRDVLRLCSARKGPFTYNQWQSAFWKLLREFDFTDEGASEGETPQQRQQRMSQWFVQDQTELHGPSYLATAIAKHRGTIVPYDGSEARSPQGMLQASGRSATGRLISSSAVSEASREESLTQSERPDLLFRGVEAQQVWRDEMMTHTELSDEEGDRIQRLQMRLELLEPRHRKRGFFS